MKNACDCFMEGRKIEINTATVISCMIARLLIPMRNRADQYTLGRAEKWKKVKYHSNQHCTPSCPFIRTLHGAPIGRPSIDNISYPNAYGTNILDKVDEPVEASQLETFGHQSTVIFFLLSNNAFDVDRGYNLIGENTNWNGILPRE